MSGSEEPIKADYRLAAFWAALFFAGMFGFPIAGYSQGWPQGIIFLGMGFSMFLLFPMVRATTMAAAQVNEATPAMDAYNKRVLFWSFAYLILFFGSLYAYQTFKPGGPVLILIALLPAIPILWTIQAIGKYLREEEDEYVRSRKIEAGIFATGLLLAIATIWGFLDIFALVPGMPGYMAVPIWAIGLGIFQIISRVRGT